MVIDRAGTEIAVTTFTDKTKVEEHKAAILVRNAEIVKQNQAIDEQLAALRKSLSDKELELARETDADKKPALQTEIDKLKAQITQTEAKRQPVIVVIGPTKFTTRDQAEAYIEQVKASAGKVKADSTAKPTASAAK